MSSSKWFNLSVWHQFVLRIVKTKGNSAKLDIRSSDKNVGKAVEAMPFVRALSVHDAELVVVGASELAEEVEGVEHCQSYYFGHTRVLVMHELAFSEVEHDSFWINSWNDCISFSDHFILSSLNVSTHSRSVASCRCPQTPPSTASLPPLLPLSHPRTPL